MAGPELRGESPASMPVMSAAQTASWHGLMDVYERVPNGWTLIGGQMVHLHCAERGSPPGRPTDDVDTVVDVRAATGILETFTQALFVLGFTPDTSGEGLQHRWRRGAAQLDVLLPEGVGERAARRSGAGGAPSLSTPGGTQALHRSETVRVAVDGRTGMVVRPNLVGALIMKAAAHTAVGDAARGRHRQDFVILAGLLERRDFGDAQLSRKDRKRLRDMVGNCRVDPVAMAVELAEDGLDRLEIAAGLRT